MLKFILIREQKLLAVQLVVFTVILTIAIVMGAFVYNKTSIFDRDDSIDQSQSIQDGFNNLQKLRQ
ncbi:MAG: hypothetical protein LBE89_01790 [Helicobacteraceae bacterium]|jgi:hypothetical protein|nr:hypothetical protein [Helicobacteraceae bacterium]